MANNLALDKQYKAWVTDLKDRIQGAQIKAAIAVNRELLRVYWELGRDIVEKQKTTSWGEKLIDQLSKDLSNEFPDVKGFSRRNLFYIKNWYSFYCGEDQIVQQVVAQLEEVKKLVGKIPWGHNILIIEKISNIEEALFYVRGTIQNNWSRAVLMLQIETGLYQRQGKAIHNFHDTLPDPQADLAKEVLKNPYNFEFMNISFECGGGRFLFGLTVLSYQAAVPRGYRDQTHRIQAGIYGEAEFLL